MTDMLELPWIDKEKDGEETPSMLMVILICDRLRLMQRGCSQRVPVKPGCVPVGKASSSSMYVLASGVWMNREGGREIRASSLKS